MNTQQSQIDILSKYLNLLIRWHKLIIICLLLAVSAALPYYLRLPDIYQSSASVIYQEQNINPSRLSPDERMRLEEMVNTVTQQVLSRKNLEDIINKFDLYPDMRKNLPIEDIMERLREKDVEVSVERQRGNVFSVSLRQRPGKGQTGNQFAGGKVYRGKSSDAPGAGDRKGQLYPGRAQHVPKKAS